ncbi:MAG TPA: hypothetical protein VFA75_13710 [Nevskia sp.]|nr:hypothetical protein [Nevskia sp.]
MKAVQRLELLKDFIQEAVDRGATSVEQIHQYIADLPFEALEKTGLLEHDKLRLREKKRRSIGMVYDAIRRINREIGQLISDQFENLEETGHVGAVLNEKAATQAPPKKKPAARKKRAPKAAR